MYPIRSVEKLIVMSSFQASGGGCTLRLSALFGKAGEYAAQGLELPAEVWRKIAWLLAAEVRRKIAWLVAMP